MNDTVNSSTNTMWDIRVIKKKINWERWVRKYSWLAFKLYLDISHVNREFTKTSVKILIISAKV